MGCPIDWTHFNSWKAYAANTAGTGYRKNVYICREGTDWYDGSILRQDGLVIDRYCTATNYLEMGNVTAASLTLTISAPPNDISSWAVGQELEVQVDIFERTDPSDPEDGGSGTAFMGYFIIDSISERSGTYTIEALDRMILLDTPMDWTGVNPASITSVLSKIETDYGITIATDVTTLPNYTQAFADTPALTARQVISAIAEVMGCCAYFDWNGELRFQWYEPVLDGSSNVVALTDEITFNSHTDPIQGIYELTDVGIGDPGDAKTETTPQAYYTEVKYNIIGNPLVESIRNSGGSVSGIATNIKNARYNISTPAEEIDFCNGEYEVLPFPYIWPLDTLQIDVTASYAPITHVTYRLNANMTLKSEVDPRVADYSSTFSNAQQTVINQMQNDTDAINKHFFYANATGAHITTVENDPDSGNNVLIDSSGVYIRENTDVLAEFTATDARIGEASSAHADISTSGLQVYESDGTTLIANLGYGPGKDSGGGTTNAPYYTLGARTGAIGNYSVAEGKDTTASGYVAHAEGYNTTATSYAHAEGSSTTASAWDSHSEGTGTTASGQGSHAEGERSEASGLFSHAQNEWTIAASRYQTTIGKFNVADSADTYALIIGNGSSNSSRSNALTVDWNGGVSCSEIKTNNYLRFTSANNPNYQYGYIVAVDGDANGSVLLIRPGASLIAGGGEYASNRWGVGDISVTNEQTFLGADSAVYIESNGGTIANRKTWTFYNGDITAPNGTVYETKYKTETVTATALYGFGYTSATNGTMYLDVMLPKKINTGSTVSVSAITAGIRGVNGLVCANSTNVLSNVSSSTAANSGCLRLTLTGMTTNFAANTPVHIYVNSITFTVS